MNCSIKKLLSLLVVMAMVVSMIVPVNFSVAKAETSAIPEAAQAEIAKGKLVKEKSEEVKSLFEGATGEVQAICPVCYANGDKTVKTWKPITADLEVTDAAVAIKLGDDTENGEYGSHVYFATEFTKDYYLFQDGLFARSGCINLNGQTVTLNGAKLITLYADKVANILDTAGNAVVTGSGDAQEHGGRTMNVLQAGAELNLFGGTYQGMNDTHASGGTDKASPTAAVTKGTLNIYEGATIVGVDGTTGNTGSRGGAVYVNSGATLNMYGGSVKDGKGSYGGNIYVQRDSATAYGTFNMYAGTVSGGYSTYAGNDAGGGNIMLKGEMNLYSGEILNGYCGYGGNIYLWRNSALCGSLNMSGGFIAGGTSAKPTSCGWNIYVHGTSTAIASLSASGGTIVGYIASYASYKDSAGSKYKPNFSGTVRLVPYGVDSQGNPHTATAVLTNTTFDSSKMTAGGILFGSDGTKAYGYCQDCGKVISTGWTVVTEPTDMTAGGHYIFRGDKLDYTPDTPGGQMTGFLKNKGNACLDLNGADITINNDRFLYLGYSGTVNVRDWTGKATVAGSNEFDNARGRVILTGDVNDLTVNVWGGTYTGFVYEGNTASNTPLVKLRQNTTFNLYEGAVIDGSNLTLKAATVFVGEKAGKRPCTFNLEGGTVIGGTNTNNDGGAFRLGNGKNTAVLNVKSGTIIGGTASIGAAIQVRPGNTLDISDGTIKHKDGGSGDLIASYVDEQTDGPTITISGGTVEGKVYVPTKSTLTLSGKPVIKDLELVDVLANVDGLSDEADITVSAEAGTILTAATENDIGNAIKHSNSELTIGKNADNQYWVVAPEEEPELPELPEFEAPADLPVEAQNEIIKGQKVQAYSNFVKDKFSGTGEVEAICPVCAAEGDTELKTWKPITADYALTDTKIAIYLGNGEGEHGDHFYFAEDFVRDYDMGQDGMFTRSGCVNFNGKTVTLNGAKIVELYANRTINFMDTKGGAVITGSSDRYGGDGKVMRVRETGAVINLYGGTYHGMNDTYDATNSNNDHADGSATIAVRGGTLNIYEGTTIVGVDGTDGNTAKNGGALFVTAVNGSKVAGTVNMYGGTIRDGHATNGGNVYIGNSSADYKGVFNMYAGEILNGSATFGGNIFVSSSSDTAYGTLNVYGGFIAGGNAGAQKFGHNIYLTNYGNETDGYASSAKLNLTGGTVVGYIAGGEKLTDNYELTVSGTAKLLPDATDAAGNAYEAKVTGTNITIARGELVKGCEVWTPQLSATYVWCDHCNEVIKWTNIFDDSAPVASAAGHIRFLENVDYTFATQDGYSAFLKASGSAYIDLQGHDVTITKGRFLTVDGKDMTVDVADTMGGAIVSGSFDHFSGNGRVIQVNGEGTTLNLYGGTYKGFKYEGANTNSTAVIRLRDSATINLYEGAVIDGSDLTQEVATIFIGNTADKPSTFNLEGGTVIGGTNTKNNGGAFRVGNGVNTAVLNVKSGTIIGGTAASGAAIQVRNGCTLNIEGGTIKHAEGGSGSLIGSYTDSSNNGTTMKISGGTVEGLVESSANSSITLSGTVVIGELDTMGNEANVAGLNAESSIVLRGYEGPVTEAYDGINNIVDAFEPADNYRMVVKEDNKIWLEIIDAKAVIEGVRYASVADALADYKYENGKAIAFLETNVTIDEDILLDVAASADDLVISGSGTVYGFDTTNDTYETYKKIKVTGDVEVAPETTTANGYRYMSLFEDEYVGFHRFVTRLTAISLRTTKAGLYYKATYQCDALVRDRVVVYGVALSVTDMPGQDFLDESGNLFTMIENEFEGAYDAATHSVKTTSGSVFGILKAVGDNERTAEKNAEYLIMDIYANSYFTVDRDGNGDTYHYMADTKNAGKKRTDEGFTGVARNLLEVVNAMNKPEFINQLSSNQKTNLFEMAAYWGQHLTGDGKIAWEAATSLMK